jgi:fructokinase
VARQARTGNTPDRRAGPRLGRQLREWLAATMPGARIVRTVPLDGGFRTDNTLLVDARGGRSVLRRYPRANRCAVEAAIAARMADIVPAAEVIAADPDGSAAGSPVLLSRFMPGVLVSELLAELDPPSAEALGRDVGRVLAAIGAVRLPCPGFLHDATLVPRPGDPDPACHLPQFVAAALAGGHADAELTADEQAAVLRLAIRRAPLAARVTGSHSLVHGDFNAKNLLAARGDAGWRVSAVLDWEFALASSTLFDAGNMRRFAADLPPAYLTGFDHGFEHHATGLPADWRDIAATLDLFALVDLVTTSHPGPLRPRAAALLRHLAHPVPTPPPTRPVPPP